METNWLVIGVDPGKFGAIVGLYKHGVAFAHPVPLIGKQAKKTEYDYHLIRSYIDPAVWQANHFTLMGIGIELPPAFMFIPKKKGMKAGFSDEGGEIPDGTARVIPAKGIVRELCHAIMGMAIAWKIPYRLITPLTWQKKILEGYPKGDKTVAIGYVQSKYPGFDLHSVGNQQVRTGVADAICVAECYQRMNDPF